MAKPDRRTERSRAALMSAFVAILLDEGYEGLTVERVAEAANVGRSTFYLHFKSKEDILRQSMARPSSVLAVLVGNTLPREAVIKQLQHFHDQRRRNRIFFEGQVRAIWIKCLAGMIEPRFAALARHLRARPVLPLSLAALQIAESQIALVANWLTLKPSLGADAVADALIASTNAAATALLGAAPGTPLLVPGERLVVREA
jgi:AcrR family transcriptional regulator